MSMRTGFARLPLHGGTAPPWLFARMARLSRAIVAHIVAEYGAGELLRRLSDPFWFQAFGCVLGFDWHSSGVTTTVCGAVKHGIRGLESELGLYVAGGKGATSRKAPGEIAIACETLSRDAASLVYASRLSAKVDSAAVQDGYQLYHHVFFFTRDGSWSVVQQGMNAATRTARRYHWLSERLETFVNEPHEAICCDARGAALDLVANESEAARRRTAELAGEPPDVTLSALERLPSLVLPDRHEIAVGDIDPRRLRQVLLRTYEQPPADFERLLGTAGVGPKTLRALALAAELIFGARTSTRDPARFAFAHGGKDGTPYPVDRERYDRTIELLDRALGRARVDRSEKVDVLKRLARFARGAEGAAQAPGAAAVNPTGTRGD